MQLRELMTPHPLTAGPGDSPEALRRLMSAGRVHHMPLVDGDRLVGMWLASDDGPVVLLGPERIAQRPPESSALDAIGTVLSGAEAVVVTQEGAPVGILTRSDVLQVVQAGLAAMDVPGVATRPLVVRLIGPAGAGKTSLLLRTVAKLRECRAGVIDANPQPSHLRLPERVAGAVVEYAPDAHWRKGLREAVDRLAGVDVVFVEDRDQTPRVSTGLGEDVQVLVVPLADAARIDDTSLRETQAIVLTKPDRGTVDEAVLRRRVRDANPAAVVCIVGNGAADPGLEAWMSWLGDRLRRHRG